MKAAIYCRVSSERQEREGTSLESQLDECHKEASRLGYEVPQDKIFSETWSGLDRDRPDFTELRDCIRNKEIDCVIFNSVDRFSRDPIPLVLVAEDADKAGVALRCIKEPFENTDTGRLILYILGYASKVEAERFKERAARGKKARIEKEGKLPSGRGVIYGYNYDQESGINIDNGCLDNVKMVGRWLLEEHIFLNEACRRLMAMSILAPRGGTYWARGSLVRIMRNPTYAGKDFAQKTITVEGKRVTCPQEKWIELPSAVDKTAFTWDEWLGIQSQLDRNRELSPRNQKLTYLLKGMVFCQVCGRKYYGIPFYGKPYYRCSSKKLLLPEQHCNTKSVNGKWLEGIVWNEVEKVLRQPQLILAELQRQKESGTNIDHLKEQLTLNENRLSTLDEAETRYLRLYGIGSYSFEKLETECKRIKLERERLDLESIDIKRRIEEAKELTLNAEKVKEICGLVSHNLESLNSSERRLALEALNIKVWIDGESIKLEGMIPIPQADTVSPPSRSPYSRHELPPMALSREGNI